MPVDQASSDHASSDLFHAHSERIDTRLSAEMGIPMFVIGEDLTGAEPPRHYDDTATNSLSRHFTEMVGTLASRKPDLDMDDVAKMLEVLADVYFTADNAAAPATGRSASPAELQWPSHAPAVLTEIATGLTHSRAIRLANFHATPRYREEEFRAQVARFAQDFEPITPANFAAAVEGRWDHPRPGLLPALFEGYRDNLDVLLPILEEFGFTAWFFVPSGFLDVPAHEQRDYAAGHQLHLPQHDEYPDDRVALTWDEARDIARRGHAFACHTRSHHAVHADTPLDVLENEITAAKAEMETQLGVPVEVFCWLEGAAVGVNPTADAMLRQAGFRYLLSNFKLQKLQ